MDEAEATQAIKLLGADLEKKQRQIEQLKASILSANTQKGNLQFEWERLKARKQPAFWWFLIISLVILKIMAYTGKKYMLVLLCEYSFLALWRALYLKRTKHAVPVAMCVIAIGLYVL